MFNKESFCKPEMHTDTEKFRRKTLVGSEYQEKSGTKTDNDRMLT